VIGRLLHDDVTGLEVDRLVIKHHVDLAGHDDGVVDRTRAMHQGIGDRHAARRALSPTIFIVRLTSIFARPHR